MKKIKFTISLLRDNPYSSVLHRWLFLKRNFKRNCMIHAYTHIYVIFNYIFRSIYICVFICKNIHLKVYYIYLWNNHGLYFQNEYTYFLSFCVRTGMQGLWNTCGTQRTCVNTFLLLWGRVVACHFEWQASWPVRFSRGYLLPISPQELRGCRQELPHQTPHGSWDLNSDPHACMASALSTEPSPQLIFFLISTGMSQNTLGNDYAAHTHIHTYNAKQLSLTFPNYLCIKTLINSFPCFYICFLCKV